MQQIHLVTNVMRGRESEERTEGIRAKACSEWAVCGRGKGRLVGQVKERGVSSQALQ